MSAKHIRDRSEEWQRFRLSGEQDPKRMRRSEVALDCSEMFRHVVLLLVAVTVAAGRTVLLVHKGDDADRSLRCDLELLQEIRDLHRNRNAARVIDSTSAEIP